MEIKKVPGGWEYQGIVRGNKEELLESIAAEHQSSDLAEPQPEDKKFELVWDPDMGKSCLRYFVALYLAERGNTLHTLQNELDELAPKIGLK